MDAHTHISQGTRRFQKIISLTLSVLWLLLILFLSFQTGEQTGELSGGMAQWLVDCLNRMGISVGYARLHALMRLAAHFLLLFVFGILLAWTFRVWKAVGTRAVFFLLLTVTAVAVLAEVGKLWIPGRHLHWDEVPLNLLGGWCGAAIGPLWRKFTKRP